MQARCISLFAFLFLLCTVVLGSPVPAAQPELGSEVGSDVAARAVSDLEARANSGKATWYNPSVGTGACGWKNKDSEKVVALGPSKYKGKCGKYVTVKSGKKSVRAKVVDLCPSCGGSALDMSPAAFKALGKLDTGVLKVTWTFS
ncbi:hypothetical protein BDV93DRAFT_520466 [Ceratobasidium sp. AG-I]|nr:hypothetical protein BDV93DRAFT_520466 [Ceratobasidium sp. AG-I]